MKDQIREEILNYYYDLETQSTYSLEYEVAYGGVSFMHRPSKESIEKKFNERFDIISNYVRLYSNQLKQTLKDNPKTVDFVVEMSYIIAPAIAQEHGGIPYVAIVAALLIMSRRGINYYLDDSK